ncbi:MAG: hypothetical protein IJZ74_12410 [Clostridia bacterium]|nr:hypothetical protein [Clostridia bacterium]
MNDVSAREQLLEGWIRIYGTSILRTCFICLSDAREAEDAMQETFLKAWRAMDRFERRNGASEKTWLTHIAINVWDVICQGKIYLFSSPNAKEPELHLAVLVLCIC